MANRNARKEPHYKIHERRGGKVNVKVGERNVRERKIRIKLMYITITKGK
jgi:hypothetical protein